MDAPPYKNDCIPKRFNLQGQKNIPPVGGIFL